MKIEILGTGCSKCTVIFENAKQALAKIGFGIVCVGYIFNAIL